MLYILTGLKSWEVLGASQQARVPHAKIATFRPFGKPGRAPDGPPVVGETGVETCLRSDPYRTLRKAVRLDKKAGRGNLKTAILAIFRGLSGAF